MSICEKLGYRKPRFIQNQFNIFNGHEQLKIIQKCLDDELLFMSYSPLAGGILTGKYSFDGKLPENTRWESWKESRGLPHFWSKENFERIEKARILATRCNVDIASIFLKWVVSFNGTGAMLLGPRNKKQIQPIRDLEKLKNIDVVSELNELFGY